MNTRINTSCGPGYRWFRGFMSRQPQLKFVAPKRRCGKKDLGFAPDDVKSYFEHLEKALEANNLFDKPDSIYNVDESGFSRKEAVTNSKVIGVRGNEVSQSEVNNICFGILLCCMFYTIFQFEAKSKHILYLIFFNLKNEKLLSQAFTPNF